MSSLPPSIQNLVDHFTTLPGIGPKTAEKLVFFLLRTPPKDLHDFGAALSHLADNVTLCSQCQNFTDKELCAICTNPRRDQGTICVVADPLDLIALEETHNFRGVYHVLGHNINPLEGITPNDIRIRELVVRIEKESLTIKEVILALDANNEGEITSLYLARLFKKYPVKVTRIGKGLPQGSDMEYADSITLSNALEGRREI
ncbi:recombination protein RecR [bacterium CG10_46_32]|nr:MAG: recombination protein RecR [bacterium CG10_46_32]PIR56387.1 MAG: recombination protein RecR [Parcubacteria group bacterium CG10_big_fil_rev_8_21_14_0_10_46_32]